MKDKGKIRKYLVVLIFIVIAVLAGLFLMIFGRQGTMFTPYE